MIVRVAGNRLLLGVASGQVNLLQTLPPDEGGAPAPLAPDAGLVTVLDGHPATLGWLGAVRGHRVQALGVEHFGQSGDIPDLYRHYGIDADAIIDACAAALVQRARRG